MKTMLSFAIMALLSTPALAAEKRHGGLVNFCRSQAAEKYETTQTAITILQYTVDMSGDYIVRGVANLGEEGAKRFQCTFNSKREFEKIKKWVVEE